MKIKKLTGLIDLYPGKKNGYKVEVTYDSGEKMDCLMHKQELNNRNYLEKMKAKMSEEDFIELSKNIEEWGEFMYDKASDEAAMDAAGADL